MFFYRVKIREVSSQVLKQFLKLDVKLWAIYKSVFSFNLVYLSYIISPKFAIIKLLIKRVKLETYLNFLAFLISFALFFQRWMDFRAFYPFLLMIYIIVSFFLMFPSLLIFLKNIKLYFFIIL